MATRLAGACDISAASASTQWDLGWLEALCERATFRFHGAIVGFVDTKGLGETT